MLIQIIRFENYIVMIVENEKELSNMLIKMNDSCKEYKMKINNNQTEILIYNKQAVILYIINKNEKLEIFQWLTYLRSKIICDEKSEMDIKSRIAYKKQKFYKKKNRYSRQTPLI